MASKIIDIKGKETGNANVEVLLASQINKQCMFEQVIAQDAGMRQGTASTLSRAEVRGGGKKPRPQKGTGRAQLGSTRASHCVGGGCAFGPKPNRNYKLYLNDKAAAIGLKSAFSLKDKNNSIYVLADTKIAKPSAKLISDLLASLKLVGKKVLVIGDDNKNLVLSAANLNRVESKNWNQVSTKDVLNASSVIIEDSAIAKIGKVVND